jgi:hypothetical protein
MPGDAGAQPVQSRSMQKPCYPYLQDTTLDHSITLRALPGQVTHVMYEKYMVALITLVLE